MFGLHSAGRAPLGTDLVGCVSALEIFLQPQGVVPPGFYSFCGEVNCEAPLIRGMPMGSKVFSAMSDACGLRPCDRTYLKNGLLPHLCAGGAYDKYREFSFLTLSFICY